MKYTLAFLLSTISLIHIIAQKKLPVLKANSSKAIIIEDHTLTTDWNIDPSVKPDVYTVSKIAQGSKIVKIKTDIDSIKISIKQGEKKDFIILLKGKDSCYTRIESTIPKDFSTATPAFHDSIRLGINEQNTMFVKAALNKTDSLTLNFDTGTVNLSLTKEALKDKIKQPLKPGPNILSIGNKKYQGFRIRQVELSGHGTDGRFGWDLFDGMVVELNYDLGVMVVHSQLPDFVKRDKSYEKLNIKYYDQLFFVETTIQEGSKKNKDWFLFDTGYQRTAMLDEPLLKEQNFPTDQMKVIKKVMMKGGQGNEIPVITANLESLALGKYKLKNIPAQLLSESRLVSNRRMNILGNEILKRFNVFLDFQQNVVYLKPNKLFNDHYVESK